MNGCGCTNCDCKKDTRPEEKTTILNLGNGEHKITTYKDPNTGSYSFELDGEELGRRYPTAEEAYESGYAILSENMRGIGTDKEKDDSGLAAIFPV